MKTWIVINDVKTSIAMEILNNIDNTKIVQNYPENNAKYDVAIDVSSGYRLTGMSRDEGCIIEFYEKNKNTYTLYLKRGQYSELVILN